MKQLIKSLILVSVLLFAVQQVSAQDDNLVRGKVFSKNEGALIGIIVVEVDQSNRNVTSAITDINGGFSMKIKNPSNKIRFSYVGYKSQLLTIGTKRVFNIEMIDNSELGPVEVVAKKKVGGGGIEVSERERSFAAQTLGKEEFDGLSVVSVDDALQGKISGLDIVANSGDVGSGTQMRIRGITSINSSSEPLIVVNGIIFEPSTQIDFSTANQEQFADLLSVNVSDIESITVLKDAAATAIWGSRGANGVIKIDTKRGAMGRTEVNYQYRYTGAVQPRGIKMLTGDDYTMYLKEAYFNPSQNDNTSNIRELNYDKTFSEYENFNNNTDWVKAVTQYGETHDHYVSLSGGGEKASFSMSVGYYTQTGTIIGQSLERYTTRMNLDYRISERIKVSSDFSLTNKDNKKNYNDLLAIAYKRMPNSSIWAQDTEGNNTNRYYKFLPSMSSQLNDQYGLVNPVAVAYLAKNTEASLNIIPTFRVFYDIFDPNEVRLKYSGTISFSVDNYSTYQFYPKELTSSDWNSTDVNKSSSNDSRGLAINNIHDLTYVPNFENKDHSLTLYARFMSKSSTSRYQNISSSNAPTGSITSSTSGAYITSITTAPGIGREMAYSFQGHYSYKDGRYVGSLTLTRNGSSRFGDHRRWGTFPGISGAWNVADEPFFAPLKNTVKTFKLRPSWGINGVTPGAEFLYYSIYAAGNSYLDMSSIYPTNIQLTDLRWESSEIRNIGLDLGFFDDKVQVYFDYYYKRISDMLHPDYSIPTSSGYEKLNFKNGGIMDNTGWELNIVANEIIKIGKFKFGANLNVSNYVNKIIELDEVILNKYNRDFSSSPMKNGEYLTRIQEKNSFGSIYGFRYKGVYQWSKYEDAVVNGGTSPFAFDSEGKVIRDANGNPLPMMYAFGQSAQYQFRGGDAIYEDVNHDGNINELDLVYLGNSNPYFNGGFNLKFTYGRISATLFSNFRVGSKIVNKAKMLAENMYSNNNQSASVNWRWRRDGQLTNVPRAMFNSGYNWLGSDRYVEDGSFLRGKNLQVNYSFPSKMIKPLNLSQLNLYLTVNNLFVITKYTGVDPEVGYGSLGVSTDDNQTPRSKSFTAAISVKF